MKHKPSYHVYRDQLNASSCSYSAWSLCYQVGQAYEKFKLRDLVTWRLKQATAATGQARSLFLYHIFCSFYNIFITTLRVAAELYIQILIN